jgi:hypothetical protein
LSRFVFRNRIRREKVTNSFIDGIAGGYYNSIKDKNFRYMLKFEGKTYSNASKLLWVLKNDKPWPVDSNGKHLFVDHIDGNTENNFIWNIKPLTNSENQQKRKINENNTSGYRGVSFRMDRKKWSARIKVGDKYLSLGLYENIIDAAMAYNKAALIYFGEYAQLNEIRGL